MHARGFRLPFTGFLLLVAVASVSGRAAAADKEAVTEQVTALNRAAVAAYGEGDFKKMKSKLTEAVSAGKEVLAGQPMLARTYLHMGVLYVDGLEDRPTGLKYFKQALKINPGIQVTAGMTTKTVMAAFEEAKKAAAEEPAAPAPAAAAAADADDEEEAPAKKPSAKDARAAAAAEKGAAKALEAERRKAAAELKEVERQATQARTDNERLKKELAQLKETEAKEHSENERLQSELKKIVTEAKRQLTSAEADSKKALAQSEAEQKKVLLQSDTEQKKLQQQLDKEREAKANLEKQVQDRDKLLAEAKQGLADAKQRIQQLEKDKADRDKTIADGQSRETKEREAKEKLEKEKQAAQAREAERKAHEEKERVDREKMAAGPDVPSHFAEKIYCDVPEIAPASTDLFVHCVAQPNLKAATLSFFYRTSGNATYNAVVMEKSRKGWFMALVPASQLGGKNLQYYTEARDGRASVAATNGKPSSPNVLTLRGGGRK